MTTLREAAQQALEALEESLYATTDKSQFLAFEAITALRAALAEPNRAQKLTEAGYTRRPTLREMAESEPCQYPDCVDNGPDGKCTRWLLGECSKSEDYKPHRPAEPVQEAVAHKHEWFRTGAMAPGEMRCIQCGAWNHEAVPPQRKPLSAADALRIATEAIGRLQSVGPVQGLVGLVRAVEAAHGIKEGT